MSCCQKKKVFESVASRKPVTGLGRSWKYQNDIAAAAEPEQ